MKPGDSARKINNLRTSRGFTQLHMIFYFPLRRECRMLRLNLWRPPPAFLVAGGPWVRPAPGIPCALSKVMFARLGHDVPRERERTSHRRISDMSAEARRAKAEATSG